MSKSETPAKKSKQERDKGYANTRSRTFQPTWKTKFTLIDYVTVKLKIFL